MTKLHWRRVFGLFVFWVMTLVLAACSATARPRFVENLQTPAVLPTRPNDGETAPLRPPDAANGAAIYAQKCVGCHGINADGQGPQAAALKAQDKIVANLINPTRARSVKPNEWHDVITKGRIENLMPPFSGSLNAQQRWDVQAYLWALGTTSQTLATGKQIFDQYCGVCHVAGDAPKLDDLNRLAQSSLLDIAGGMAAGDAHKAMKLGEAERFAVADAVRALAYIFADPAALREQDKRGDGLWMLRAISPKLAPSIFANAQATLRAYDVNGEVLTRTAALDAAGVVTFANLPRRPDLFYQPEVLFDGVTFYAAPQQFSITDTQALSGVVALYETTHDASAIRVPESYFFVQDVGEEGVSVVEVYFISNTGEKAFVEKLGDGRTRSLQLGVPADARNLRFDPPQLENRFTVSGTTLFYNDVVEPGERVAQVTVLYELPYRDGKRIVRSAPYPVDAWAVLLPVAQHNAGTPLTITAGSGSGGGLVNHGLQNTPAGPVILFRSAQPVAANAMMEFQLSGQPRVAPVFGADGASVGMGALAVALALGVAYWLLRRVRQIRTTTQQPLKTQRDQLLYAIAELDADYAEGKLKDAYYQRRRQALKDELKAIWD